MIQSNGVYTLGEKQSMAARAGHVAATLQRQSSPRLCQHFAPPTYLITASLVMITRVFPMLVLLGFYIKYVPGVRDYCRYKTQRRPRANGSILT